MKYPGFIDSHLHVLGMGYVSTNIDLTEVNSIESTIQKLKNHLNSNITIGRGWNQEQFQERRMLTKQDLNRASSTKPIVCVRVCGHVLTVNDKMLELANINQSTPHVEGGTFDYETGIFTEKALSLIYDKLPLPTREEIKKYFIKANAILLENGITSVASDDFCTFPIDFEEIIDIVRELYKDNQIQVKITEQVNIPYDDLRRFIEKGYVNADFGSFKMGPLKILADGSLGGKTAFLNEVYEGENHQGVHTYSDEELFQLVHLADSNQMDVVIHAIGDGAVDQVLKAIIRSLEITGRTDHHHAIIHAQLTNRRQIQLMKDWNIGAIVQPIFLNTDIPIIHQRIGERAKESYLFHSMYRSGINVGFSTDAPIEPVNPFKNIYTAMTRTSMKYPELGPFLAAEGFQLDEAMECYTKNNLPYIYEDALPEGDYIIIHHNLTDTSPLELKDIKVLETYIDHIKVFPK